MIIQKPSSNFFSRDNNPIKYIVVHISVGTLSSLDNTFQNPNSEVSAHYGVGLNGEIHQYVAEDMGAWHAGRPQDPTAQIVKDNLNINQNKISLGIENEGNDLSKAPEAQLNALVGLIQSLAIKYKIPVDRTHIIGHREITTNKPTCPSFDNTTLDKIVARCQVVPPSNAKQLVAEIKERIIKLETLL